MPYKGSQQKVWSNELPLMSQFGGVIQKKFQSKMAATSQCV